MRRRLASALWLLLAFLVWNVRFDYGVRVGAKSYLNQRALALRHAAPDIEMASAMRATIAGSARAATWMALPFTLVGLTLARRSHRQHPPPT